MKKLAIILFTFLFILTSCLNPEEEIFEKQIKCSSLYQDVFNELESKYGKIENGINETGYYQIENPKIYYSKKINSCIALIEVIEKIESDEISAIYKLEAINILNKEIIDGITCIFKTTGNPINGIPQHSTKDMKDFSNCTKIYHNNLDELLK